MNDGWSRILLITGYIGMVVGAIDPLEGSVLILAGSALVALAYFLAKASRNLVIYRSGVFVLITVGVSALWALSIGGGIGDGSGRSWWWGLLILPYLIGWSAGIWGPGSPRWVLVTGSMVCLWYLALLFMLWSDVIAQRWTTALPAIVLGITGVLTLGGCIYRLRSSGMRPNEAE